MGAKHPKDFWAGVMYLVIGIGAVLIARNYNLGTAGRMGPGYFPTILAGLLALIGAASIVRSYFHEGEAITPFAWRKLAQVIGSIVLFGILVRGAGLAIALMLLVLISAWASVYFKWKSALLLALGTTVFSVLLFVKALGVPFPILGSWFGI